MIKDMPLKILPMVGNKMKVSSKMLRARKNGSWTCFLMGTMLLLAI